LGLPKRDDVKQGCVAYRIAAHAADVALGIPGSRDWDDELTKARAALNWEKHFELAFDSDTARAYHDEDMDVDTDFCAMCGHDWCAVRISKEITSFVSGKDEAYAWEKPKISEALSEDQKDILQKRGVLSPEELHRLASKTRDRMSAQDGPAQCHSEVETDEEIARSLQQDVLETASSTAPPVAGASPSRN
jgi:phosphomethylpyrimidine synthase